MNATFETIYPRVEFAPLVRLAIAVAGWMKARGDEADGATPAHAASQSA